MAQSLVQPLGDAFSLAMLAVDIGGAVAATTVAAWLVGHPQRFGPAGTAIIAGLLLTAAWCVVVAVTGDRGSLADLAEAGRNIAWLIAIYRLFASDGRHASLAPIRPVLLVLAGVELLHLAMQLLTVGIVDNPEQMGVAFDFTVLCRLLVSVGALVLVHNLYAGASRLSQPMLRWPAAGLAVLWVFDLNLYTIAYLGGDWPEEIAASRGLAVLVLACLLAIGAAKGGEALRFKPSRAVTFQTFSLLVIGAYLVAMVAIAQWLSYAGGDFARLMELGFLTIASALAILILPSRRLRGWLKVTLAKHFFQHRYDYREEWLRFTRTIGNGGEEALPLGERVVQAVADIAEAPAGMLLAPGDQGELTLAARWQWGGVDVPSEAMSARSVAFFEREGFIVQLDDLRQGKGEVEFVPEWLRNEPRAWALVPLIHYERLVGMVVLARPLARRKFDWEDFDLMRVVGQQLASYLAEHAGQEALAEASRFDDFHRRIAFVMHDIKNLASQLSLLAHNAELHAEKPAFRADMLVTLTNSADKLNTLLARLSRYGGGHIERLGEVRAEDVARGVVAQFRATRQVLLAECQPCVVRANRESLEQVLVHLTQNAVDASDKDGTVFLSLIAEGLHARFEVIDSGCGMSPDFVRTKLFKPFVSSKQGGFGIGAFEARELVRAMQGRLEVESREGLGSRFIVRLPLAVGAELLADRADSAQRLAS
jgi:putative PEP-CTERM system histidine kinase